MFDRVMNWLEAEPEGHSAGFSGRDTRSAVAALFYHMIAVDGLVTEGELARLRELLQSRYELNESQLSRLTGVGERTDRKSAGVFPFTVILNRELSEEEKLEVFQQLETLALADGILHPLERDLLDHLKFLLKLD